MSPPAPGGRDRRGRSDRRYDEPAYPLQEVHALAARHYVRLTRKAAGEAARFLGDEVVSIHSEIVAALRDLTVEDWQFRQVKDGQWVDVYRLGYDPPPDAWIKLRIERPPGYPAVVVISFHEFES